MPSPRRRAEPVRKYEAGPAWTDERRQTAFTLWDAGQSAQQIAEALGGVSRNAVLGVLHRAGKTRTDAERRTIQAFNARAGVIKRGWRAKPPKPPKVVKVISDRQTFVQADAAPPAVVIDAKKFTPICGAEPVHFGAPGCKWPVGESDGGILCCGRGREGDRPYCAEHSAVAFVPLTYEQKRLARNLRRFVA